MNPADCRNSRCTVHPHCVCGARLDDDGAPQQVCPECGTAVLVDAGSRRAV